MDVLYIGIFLIGLGCLLIGVFCTQVGGDMGPFAWVVSIVVSVILILIGMFLVDTQLTEIMEVVV